MELFILDGKSKRKAKLMTCKKCQKEWLIRSERSHSGFCRSCRIVGEKNPQYGKESHNKGYLKYGMSYTKYRWIQAKKEVVLMLGNQCIKCNEKNMPIYCYELHHRDRKTKKFSVLSKLTAWWNAKLKPVILEEINKCDLICKNCHAIHHYGIDRAE